MKEKKIPKGDANQALKFAGIASIALAILYIALNFENATNQSTLFITVVGVLFGILCVAISEIFEVLKIIATEKTS